MSTRKTPPTLHSENTYAANPYGCNQYGHKPGCPHKGGGVDPELGKNLEAALRRARNADGSVSRDGELSRNHEVRLRGMPEVLKLLGEPDVPLVMTVYHIRKLHKSHGLSVEQMCEVAAKLNDPLLVMQADVQKYLVLLDMDAYEEHDKAMRPVICFVEKKPGKTHAEYVVSAYPLQKEKYRKVTGQINALLYSKFRDEKTAQFAADAPQCSEARDLLRAAIRSGFGDNIPTFEDVVKRKRDGVQAAAKALRHEEYVPALTPDATYRTAQEWAELAPEMRAGRFFLACVEDERLLLAMHKLVDECMQEGVSEDEFIHRAFLMLGEITDPLSGEPYYDPAARQDMPYDERVAYDNDVSNIDARARLKLIYRTQSELAAGYAQWQKALAPENLRRFPAWRFVRQPGAKIKRPDHVEHENEVRLISDTAYWLARNSPDQGGFNNPFPPFGYNSWMRVERVSRKEAVRLGLLAQDEEPAPPPDAERWSLRQAVEQANTASLESLPPESVERIKERCRGAGLELHPAEGGGYTAKPAPGAPFVPFHDDLEEELNELLRMIDGEDEPAPDEPALPWLASLFGKLLPPADTGDVYAANPYGCNGAGHKSGCPKGDTQRLTAPEKWKPASLPRISDPGKWQPISRPRQIRAIEGLRRLRMGITVKDPTGKKLRLTYDIFCHWVREGKKLSDIRLRLRNLNRALMAIRQPNEIRINEKGERLYLSAQQYEKSGRTQGERSFYVAISVKNGSEAISTYYYYDNKDKIKQKQEGECVYLRRAPKRRRSRFETQ